MSEEYISTIPLHGDAKVAFLGVDVQDTYVLIGSVFAGFILGGKLGLWGYLGIPFVGYFITRAWVDMRSANLPGAIGAKLYRSGLIGYSKSLSSGQIIYVGDNDIINPNIMNELLEESYDGS